MADTINTSSGESVFFSYNSAQNACEKINSIATDMKEKLELIRQIIDKKDSIWKGEAADRFWTEFEAKGKDYSLDEMDTITSNSIPKAVNAVFDLIAQNKAVDSDLMSKTFTEVGANDNVQSSTSNVQADGVNQEGINAVHANDNVQSNTATTDATGVNQEGIDATHANDDIQSNTATTDATGVNTQIIDSVHTEDNIQSSSSDVQAEGVNTDTIDSVTTSGAFSGNNSSTDTTSTGSTGNTAYDKIVNSLENDNK